MYLQAVTISNCATGDIVTLFSGLDYSSKHGLVDYRVKKFALACIQAVHHHRYVVCTSCFSGITYCLLLDFLNVTAKWVKLIPKWYFRGVAVFYSIYLSDYAGLHLSVLAGSSLFLHSHHLCNQSFFWDFVTFSCNYNNCVFNYTLDRNQLKDQLLLTPEESSAQITLLLEAVVLLIDPKLPWTCKVVGYLLQRNVFNLLRELVLKGKVCI